MIKKNWSGNQTQYIPMNTNNNRKAITKEAIAASLKQIHNINTDTLFSYPHSKQEALLNEVFLDLIGIADGFSKEPKPDEMEQMITNIGNYYEAREDEAIAYHKLIDRMRQQWRLEHPKQAIENITKEEVTTYLLKSHKVQNPETLFYNAEANASVIVDVNRIFSGHFYDSENGALVGELTPMGPAKTAVSYRDYQFDELQSLDDLIQQVKAAVELTAEHYENNKGILQQANTQKTETHNKVNTITTDVVTNYIKQTFHLENPDEVFTDIKTTDPKRYFDIIDTTFFEFAEYWMSKNGFLMTYNPIVDFNYTIRNYPGYDKLNSIDALVEDLQDAIQMKEDHLNEQCRMMDMEQDNTQGQDIKR